MYLHRVALGPRRGQSEDSPNKVPSLPVETKRLASRNSSYSRLISCTRASSVVLETHQLYSKD